MGADQLHGLEFQGSQARGGVAPDTALWMRVVAYVRRVVLEYCWSSCVVWSASPRRSRSVAIGAFVPRREQILLRGICRISVLLTASFLLGFSSARSPSPRHWVLMGPTRVALS